MRRKRDLTKKDIEKLLTDKQRRFCLEYVIDWNATRAAIKAGYKEKSATVIAHENLRKPYIKKYLDFVRKDYEKLCGVSKMRQIREYSKIAYSSISHLHNTWIELKDFKNLTDEQKEAIESIETRTQVRSTGRGKKKLVRIEFVKIKLYNKIAALERIDKLMGYNEPEKIETEVKGGTVLILPSNNR